MSRLQSFWRCVSRSFIVLCLIFSLLFTTGVNRVYAAAPAVPAAFSLLETLFLSLGFSIGFNELILEDDIPDHILEDVEAYMEKVEEVDQTPLEAFIEYIQNITDYYNLDGTLTVPEDAWIGANQYVDSKIDMPLYYPLEGDVPVISDFTLTDFKDWFSEYTGISYSLNGDFEDACVELYGWLSDYSNFSGIISSSEGISSSGLTFTQYELYLVYSSYNLNFCLTEGSDVAVLKNGTGNYSSQRIVKCYSNGEVSDTGVSTTLSADENIVAFWYKGIPYDFWDIYSIPSDVTLNNDYGTTLEFSQLQTSVDSIADGVDMIISSDAAAGAVDNGVYDVLSPGRELEDDGTVVGDVVIGIPSDSLLEDYYSGLITWEQLLDEVGVVPVDTATDTTIATGEAVEDVYYKDFASLENSVKSIPERLLDGLLGLFIPSDGFWQQWFNRVLQFFEDKLGFLYTSIEILIEFLTDLLESEPSEAYLNFPGIYITFEGTEYCLAEAQDVSLNMSDYFPGLQDKIHFVTSVMMIGWVFHLGQKKLEEMMTT